MFRLTEVNWMASMVPPTFCNAAPPSVSQRRRKRHANFELHHLLRAFAKSAASRVGAE